MPVDDPLSAPTHIIHPLKPDGNETVADFLAWPYTVARPGSRRWSVPPEDWFSFDPPTEQPASVADLILPSSRLCVALDDLLEQSAKQGYRSVTHPVHEDRHLPLWVIRAWKCGNVLLEQQHAWSSRLRWVDQTAESEGWTDRFLEAVRECILAVPWMAGLPALQRGTVSSFALADNLLSHRWLNDDTMNCTVDVIRVELNQSSLPPNAPAIHIATTHLRSCLSNPGSNMSTFWAKTLVTAETAHFLLPCNVAGCHWIALDVDVTEQCINIGDSKPAVTEPHREALLDEVRAWLQRVFPEAERWRIHLSGLHAGQQLDDQSCGIATLNAIHRLVVPGSPCWSPRYPGLMRAYYFRRCVEVALEVGVSSVLSAPFPHVATDVASPGYIRGQ